jgi:hypothetical protein
MSTLQVFLIGAIVSWAPSLLLMAYLICRAPTDLDEASSTLKRTRGLRARLGKLSRGSSRL